MRFVFVEPTLQHLLLCLKFIEEHEVILIDSYAEVGTPSFQIGWCHSPEVFCGFLTEEETNFLQLSKSKEGYGFRVDWLVKHLIRKCVMQGVQVFSRTTILDTAVNETMTTLHLQSPANLPDLVEADVVHVDMSVKRIPPGRVDHNLPVTDFMEQIPPPIVQWSGILIPTKYVDELINGITLNRSDGCSEVWSKETEPISPYTMEKWTLYLGEDLHSSQFEAILEQSNKQHTLLQHHIQGLTS